LQAYTDRVQAVIVWWCNRIRLQMLWRRRNWSIVWSWGECCAVIDGTYRQRVLAREKASTRLCMHSHDSSKTIALSAASNVRVKPRANSCVLLQGVSM